MVLASLATIAVAKWAQAFLVPLTAGILIAYALKPVVTALERLHVHRAVAAVLVLAAVSGTIVGAVGLETSPTANTIGTFVSCSRLTAT